MEHCSHSGKNEWSSITCKDIEKSEVHNAKCKKAGCRRKQYDSIKIQLKNMQSQRIYLLTNICAKTIEIKSKGSQKGCAKSHFPTSNYFISIHLYHLNL